MAPSQNSELNHLLKMCLLSLEKLFKTQLKCRLTNYKACAISLMQLVCDQFFPSNTTAKPKLRPSGPQSEKSYIMVTHPGPEEGWEWLLLMPHYLNSGLSHFRAKHSLSFPGANHSESMLPYSSSWPG